MGFGHFLMKKGVYELGHPRAGLSSYAYDFNYIQFHHFQLQSSFIIMYACNVYVYIEIADSIVCNTIKYITQKYPTSTLQVLPQSMLYKICRLS